MASSGDASAGGGPAAGVSFAARRTARCLPVAINRSGPSQVQFSSERYPASASINPISSPSSLVLGLGVLRGRCSASVRAAATALPIISTKVVTSAGLFPTPVAMIRPSLLVTA